MVDTINPILCDSDHKENKVQNKDMTPDFSFYFVKAKILSLNYTGFPLQPVCGGDKNGHSNNKGCFEF